MIIHNDLRVDVNISRDFDGTSLDDSSMLSCPSFASSSGSGSRRDSVISSPYDPSYGPESHDIQFTESSSFLDIDHMPSITQDELDISLDSLLSAEKPIQTWSVNLSGLRFSSNGCGSHVGQDVNYCPAFPQTPVRRVRPHEGFPRRLIDSLQMSSNVTECSMPEFTSATVTPSVTFTGSQYTPDFSPLTPPAEQPHPSLCSTDQCHQSNFGDPIWTTEGSMFGPLTSHKTPSRNVSCSPKGLMKRSSSTKPTRSFTKGSTTKVRKCGVVSDCPRAKIECKYKSITGCTKKFQRSEHLTRHLKSAAHCPECPFVCELEGCVDQKTGKRTSFNRKDNKNAHIVNCHLMDSDKPRRDRVRDPKLIRELGWEALLPHKEKEEEKRRIKALAAAQKSCPRTQSSARMAKRAGTKLNAKQ